MSTSGVSRTDVPYVGPVTTTGMILAADSFSPVSYYTLVVDSDSKLYFSQGVFGDALYDVDNPLYQIVYVTPKLYTATNGSIVAGSITMRASINSSGSDTIGYIFQDVTNNQLTISATESAVALQTVDPNGYPTTDGFETILSGVRYQFNPAVNLSILGYVKDYGTGLYGGTSDNVTSMSSNSIWMNFVQNSAYMMNNCNILNSMSGLLPSTAVIAQCYALSGSDFTPLTTCSGMTSSSGFNDATDCANNPVLFYYAFAGDGCGSTYKFTNFKNVSQQVTSSIGDCDSGLTCVYAEGLYACSEINNSRRWLWIFIIAIALLLFVIIIVAIIAAIAKSSKSKTTEVTTVA